MLENVITNPIDTPRGYKNPVQGIALRGPLSQFFSGIYLKKLDDAFNFCNSVDYLHYNDDILILCQTKRQFNRCRRKLMEILKEKHLTISRKKSRMGSIHAGFHFLGVNYLGTQPQDKTNVAYSNDDVIANSVVNSLTFMGGETRTEHLKNEPMRIVPHARTLRNARVQVKAMVTAGFSVHQIRTYLQQWACWWTKTSETWQYDQILRWFIELCWEILPAAYATGLLLKSSSEERAFDYDPMFAMDFLTKRQAG